MEETKLVDIPNVYLMTGHQRMRWINVLIPVTSNYLVLGGVLDGPNEVPASVRRNPLSFKLLDAEGTTVMNLAFPRTKDTRIALNISEGRIRGPVPEEPPLVRGRAVFIPEDNVGTFCIGFADPSPHVLLGIDEEAPTTYEWRVYGRNGIPDIVALCLYASAEAGSQLKV